jgi:IS4 transposase
MKRVWFVTRAKVNIDYAVTGQHRIKGRGVMSDERISLTGPLTKDKYPRELRLIRFSDEERQKTLTFLTNNFRLAATTIAQIYKSRWQIELFFKWIKQHLRIKASYGTSPNAVKTQIWIAISVYVLVAIIKKKLKIDRSLSEILQILSITLLENSSLLQLFTDSQLQRNGAIF